MAKAKKTPEAKASGGRDPAPPAGSQRVRKAATNAPPVESRVREIMAMMVDGEWQTGLSGIVLAQRWGVAVNTVEQSAAEASRAIKIAFDLGDKAELKARYLAKLESNTRAAASAQRFEAVKGLLELEGKVMGYFDPDSDTKGGTTEVHVHLAPTG